MELNNQQLQSARIKKLIKEKRKLLDELGVKMRRKIIEHNGNLGFIEDHPNFPLKISGAKELGEVEMDDLQWEKLKIEGLRGNIELKKQGKKIVNYSKKVVK